MGNPGVLMRRLRFGTTVVVFICVTMSATFFHRPAAASTAVIQQVEQIADPRPVPPLPVPMPIPVPIPMPIPVPITTLPPVAPPAPLPLPLPPTPTAAPS